ncbi:MAG: helix-turn-helix domain-containing protein [Acidimicrobiales bacterium]
MDGIEMFRVGRQLMKLGLESMPPFRDLPTGVRIVLVDVFEHPGTTIGRIAARTGFPQSQVSSAVARLRTAGVLLTEVDPRDRRRTLVAPSPGHRHLADRARRELRRVEDLVEVSLVDRLGPDGADYVGPVIASLELLADLFVRPDPTDAKDPTDPLHATDRAQGIAILQGDR